MSRITIGHLELMKNSRFDEMIDTMLKDIRDLCCSTPLFM